MKRLVLIVALLLVACDTTVTKEEMETADYGPKPERWQDEIRNYLSLRLNDPKNALVDFKAGPTKLYQRGTPVRGEQYGWGVCVFVVDKPKDGGDDRFPMTFIFRNEKIVAVNGGPDDANVIGARYSRDQCERMGTRFNP